MKLAEYLNAKSIKRGDFAREIDVTAGWVTCLCDGSGWPSQAVAERIAAVTAGEVTANDFTTSPPQAPDHRDDSDHGHADDGAAADTVDAHEVSEAAGS